MNYVSHKHPGFPAPSGRLCFYLFLLSAFLSGIPRLSAQISGPANVCAGQATTFSATGTPSPAYTYLWSVIPPGNSTILSSSGSAATIQWSNTVSVAETIKLEILRPGERSLVWTKAVRVYPEPDPRIGTSSKVACQGSKDKKGVSPPIVTPGDGIIIDDSTCLKVCERSSTRYFITGRQPGSTYQWSIDGSKGAFRGSSSDTAVDVAWDTTLGFTYIKVKETTAAGCTREQSICIEIIESLRPEFSVNGSRSDGRSCLTACIKEPVQFADLTPNASSSPVTSWQWDFGDGSYSSLQHPQHMYHSSGRYTVRLKVTNQCGCEAEYIVCLDLSDPDGPPKQILCPSAVCAGTSGHYTIDNKCDAMFWTVTGGTITAADAGSVDVYWHNTGSSGFGELIADFSNCGGKCSPKVTARIPVIAANGTIEGLPVICMGKQFRYQLPQWPATNFKWSVIPADAATIAYEENSNEVYLTASRSFTLHCEYVNTLVRCSGKAELPVRVLSPMHLSAPPKVCKGTPFTVATTIPAATGTSFSFTDPNGVIAGGSSFNTSGLWTIQAAHPDYCEVMPVNIQVLEAPPTAGSIRGQQKVCLNMPYVYTAVNPVPNTACTWTILPAGAGTIISSTGNAVTIKWLSAGSKILQLSRSWTDMSECVSATTTLNIQDALSSVNISGNTAPCANTSVRYTATPVAGAVPPEDISWALSDPALGSISSGQNTMNPTVSWNNIAAASAVCTLTATITQCANSNKVNYPVTITGIPAITITTSNPTPCSGTPVTFTASVTPATATVSWTFPPGTATVSPGTTATTTFTNLGLASQNVTVIAAAAIAGCAQSGNTALTIAVKPQPNINVSPGSGSTYSLITCSPVHVPLLLSTNTTAGIYWYHNPPSAAVGSGQTYTATAAGIYEVMVRNDFGCSSSLTRNISLGSCIPGCTPPTGSGLTSKNYEISNCTNDSGDAVIDVRFNGIKGSYMGSGTGPVITGVYPTGGMSYFSVPAATINFPDVIFNGIKASKPGIYPVSLTICYQTPTVPCCTTITQNIIIPLLADFDYITSCNGSGYMLQLNDQTPVLAGYTISSQSWSTTSSGGPGTTAALISLSAYTPGSILNITHHVTVTGPAGTFNCSRTRKYTVPPAISPAFSMTTTDPLGPGNSTCALREVRFISGNNTGVRKWTWDFGDGTNVIRDNASAFRTYTNPAADYNATVRLMLTDSMGCHFSITRELRVRRNTLSVNKANTYTLAEDIKCQGSSSVVLLSTLSGGHGGNTFAWYNEQTLLPEWNTNPINVTRDGRYWTRVTDQRGCQVTANPTAAKRAFQPLPEVTITGAHDYCAYQDILLSASNDLAGAVRYQWQIFNGASWINIPGAVYAPFSPGGMDPGVYEYRVMATQSLPPAYSGACTAISPTFTVTVHPVVDNPYPAPPVALQCDNYSIQLAVAHPQPGIIYNWSNGAAGPATVVNHGGAYRIWATDSRGCSSMADVHVPMDPASYFWRFPRGCYSFCPEHLPRRIDGPANTSFSLWAWQLNDRPLPYPNGPWASGGSNNSVDPLNLNIIPASGDGNGRGNYTWFLGNELCRRTSEPMSLEIKNECCRMDAQWIYFNCLTDKETGQSTFYGGLVPDAFDCSPITYTIYALDPSTGLPNGSVTPVSGTYTRGSTIHFAYVPFDGTRDVQFQVVLRCLGKECVANPKIVYGLGQVPCKELPSCGTAFEWNYFKCTSLYGAAAPRFAGSVKVSNPFGCSTTVYTITAVDPLTGLPNGTVIPASGSFTPGAADPEFTYIPDPTASSVEFRITTVCEGRVCRSMLGSFNSLYDKEKYPCEKDKECNTEIRWNYFVCTPSGSERHRLFNGSVQVYNPYGCSTMNYEIIAVDPSLGTVNGIVTSSTGTLAAGMNTLLFSYEPDAGIPAVKFLVRFFCTDATGSVHCISTLGVFDKLEFREQYPCKDGCQTDVKWDRFVCVKPRGATAATFIGRLDVHNPFADCPDVRYSITAVDPVTGIVNGTVTVAGPVSLAGGWNSLSLSYDPDPGVSRVRFLITFICVNKELCTAELGKYDGLDDKAKYPCRDYFKMAAPEAQGIHMLIAPNPANDKVTISYDIPAWKQDDLYEIAVVNLLGQTIANYKVDGTTGAWQLNTTQLAAGTYLVRMVKDGGNVDVQRMIIAH